MKIHFFWIQQPQIVQKLPILTHEITVQNFSFICLCKQRCNVTWKGGIHTSSPSSADHLEINFTELIYSSAFENQLTRGRLSVVLQLASYSESKSNTSEYMSINDFLMIDYNKNFNKMTEQCSEKRPGISLHLTITIVKLQF